jgi:hypothetical protein
VSDQDRQKPQLLGLALGALCLVAFVGGFWRPLADGFDRKFPSRDGVSKLADASLAVEVSVDSGASDSEAVRSALRVLPASLVRTVRDFGGRVVIVKRGTLASIAVPGMQELHQVVGLYVPKTRVAYVASDSEAPGETALHEIGHLLDHALGSLTSKTFLPVYQAARKDKRIAAKYRDDPKEFFAEFFATYYFSDRSREWLSRRATDASRYLAELEAHEHAPSL